MESVLESLLGPLAAIECRRSLRRGWVLLVRALATLPAALVLLAVLWFWWFQRELGHTFDPGPAMRAGLVTVAMMLVTVALLLVQAQLAGSLAGEHLREGLSLLLATQVSSREIVLGRLAGRFAVFGAITAAGLPPLIWFAVLWGLEPLAVAVLVVLPFAVGFGGAGLTLAISAVSKRGRDALLLTYLVELLLLLTPLFAGFLPARALPWIEPLNPYLVLGPLAEVHHLGPALWTIACWTALGVAGCLFASWRLRPAQRFAAEGSRKRWRSMRLFTLPLLDRRPMLWKELYAEAQAFGWSVKWLGILGVLAFVGTSLVLAVIFLWETHVAGDPESTSVAFRELAYWMSWSWLMSWMFQCAVGLRAAAAIASERQRSTWDGLLICPLEGREIVIAKMMGSAWTLRWFFVALLFAWVAGLCCEAISLGTVCELVAQTVFIGAFMVVVGTYFSLSSQTPTRAMTLTIVTWMVALCVTTVLAGFATMLLVLAWVAWHIWRDPMLGGAGLGGWPGPLYHSIHLGLYALATLFAIGYSLRRFDTLAGRCPQEAPGRRARRSPSSEAPR